MSLSGVSIYADISINIMKRSIWDWDADVFFSVSMEENNEICY